MADPVYLTINEFPGTGAPAPTVVDFAFAGGYISPAHVKAELFDPVTYLRTPVTVTDEHFVTDYRLSLPISVPSGQVLRVYRDTPKDQPLVNFTNGARIAENNLDLVAAQAVFVAAESADQIAATQIADVLQAVESSAANAAASQTAAAASAASAAASEASAQAGASASGAFAVDASNSAAAAAASAADALGVRADLATTGAGKGAEMVAFKQSGTMAVDRTASDKLRETVSVGDFGAVGGLVADDTAAIQIALDAGGEFSDVLLTGAHRITAKLKVHKGQRLVGGNESWFINTNSGTTWAGPLSGTLPKYGIFYDSSTGEAIETEEGSILEGFHLWGRGYTTLGVDIQKPNPATIHAATGVKNTKFLTARNLSVYYFQTAFHSTGGDYYSRYDHVEVTRCTKAFKWDLATFNQVFNKCVLRVVDLPFEFASYARGIKWFGGSIEGYTQETQIRPFSSLYFSGAYFETMNDLAAIPSVFKFIGGAALLKIEGCDIYLNHCTSFVSANSQQRLTVQSNGNRFFVNSGSITAAPVAYLVPSTALNGRYSLKNDAFLTDDADIRSATTSSITSGSTALTVASAIVSVGQRIVVIGAGAAGGNLTTTATAVSGTSVTLRDPAGTTVAGATVNTYTTAVYVPYTMGTGLLGFDIVPPVDSLPRFTDVEFGGRKAFGLQAQTAAPVAVFNGGAAGVAVYTADGTSWNPASKADGRGAYPVAYRGGKYIPMLGGFVGSFMLTAAATRVVSEPNMSANSKVFLMPTNAAAATLMQSTKSLYISAKSAGTSFTVATADGTNAAGTEAFDYFIYD